MGRRLAEDLTIATRARATGQPQPPVMQIIRRVIWIASVASAAASAWSQTPPEEVVQMEAFNVSTTVGKYHEETSSMATKIPMNLKEVASSLQILNANALTDRNATTLQDVYTYIIGMNQVQTNANGFTFRGFSNAGTFTQNIEYDGLQGASSSKGALSAANVESVEFLKGPNSVLYGQMHPGGMLNIVTKSPTQTRHTSVRTSFMTYAGRYNDFGSANGVVGTLDTAGPIDAAKHWLYRLVVSGQDLHPFRTGDYERDLYLYPSLTYQWSKETSFTVKLENIRERRRLDGPLHVFKVNTGVKGLAWMIVRPLRSLGQHDELRTKGFGEILTPQEDAKMVELRAASMESAEERFFRIEPQISRVPAAWVRRSPGFWSGATP